MNKPNIPIIDPTDTEHSHLVIEPEDLTQWVDGELTNYHAQNINLLAAKHPLLNQYKADIDDIKSVIKQSFNQKISAPADTTCRFLKALKETTSSTNEPCLAVKKEVIQELPIQEPVVEEDPRARRAKALAEIPTLKITLNYDKPLKKAPPYLYPIAALLVLGCFLTTFSLISNSKKGKTSEIAMVNEESQISFAPNSRILDRMKTNSKSPHDPDSPSPLQLTLEELESPHKNNSVIIHSPKEVKVTPIDLPDAPKTNEGKKLTGIKDDHDTPNASEHSKDKSAEALEKEAEAKRKKEAEEKLKKEEEARKQNPLP